MIAVQGIFASCVARSFMGDANSSVVAYGPSIDEIEGIIGASLFGSLLAVGLLHFADPTAVRMVGATVGVGTLVGGGLVLFIVGLLFGLLFLVFVSGSVNAFVNQAIMLSSRSSLLRKLIVPLLNRSALGVTLLSLGTIYGIAVGIIVFGIAVPMVHAVADGNNALGFLRPALVVAWIVYGSMMGLTYGLILER